MIILEKYSSQDVSQWEAAEEKHRKKSQLFDKAADVTAMRGHAETFEQFQHRLEQFSSQFTSKLTAQREEYEMQLAKAYAQIDALTAEQHRMTSDSDEMFDRDAHPSRVPPEVERIRMAGPANMPAPSSSAEGGSPDTLAMRRALAPLREGAPPRTTSGITVALPRRSYSSLSVPDETRDIPTPE